MKKHKYNIGDLVYIDCILGLNEHIKGIAIITDHLKGGVIGYANEEIPVYDYIVCGIENKVWTLPEYTIMWKLE